MSKSYLKIIFEIATGNTLAKPVSFDNSFHIDLKALTGRFKQSTTTNLTRGGNEWTDMYVQYVDKFTTRNREIPTMV